MNEIAERDRTAEAKQQGQAQFDSIRELVEALRAADELDSKASCEAMEAARERIQEDPLSVEVRGDWHSPGSLTAAEACSPSEYRILLCTGGPAVQLRGELSEHGEPTTCRMQVQDWFTPWTDFRPRVDKPGDEPGMPNYDSEPVLLEYARQFYFGE